MCKVFKHAVTIYIMCNLLQYISEYYKNKPKSKDEYEPISDFPNKKKFKKITSSYDFNIKITDKDKKTNKYFKDNGWGQYVDIS